MPNNHNHEGRTSPCLQVPAWLHFGVSPHIPKHRDSRTFGGGGGKEGHSLFVGITAPQFVGVTVFPKHSHNAYLGGGRGGGRNPTYTNTTYFGSCRGGKRG